MGFYAPAQIVCDADAHGVEIRPVCANASRWDCTLEPTDDDGRFAVRLGLRMVKGLANAHGGDRRGRADRPFASVDDLRRRAAVPQAALVRLACRRLSFRLRPRATRGALGDPGLDDTAPPLFVAAAEREARLVPEVEEPRVPLRPMPAGGEVVADYRHTGLSLRRHPVALPARRAARAGSFPAARP